MKQNIPDIVKQHIHIIKYNFPDVKVKIEILGDDVFILHNNPELVDNEIFQKLVYDFSMEYIKQGFYNIFWASDTSIADDDVSLLRVLSKTRGYNDSAQYRHS
ncbi:MAG: hypothetical protein Kow00102_03150 [Spirochaetota bacterium]|nr:hypothetical protein [Spirochaetota bacterium]